jgi:hypothetical protein
VLPSASDNSNVGALSPGDKCAVSVNEGLFLFSSGSGLIPAGPG